MKKIVILIFTVIAFIYALSVYGEDNMIKRKIVIAPFFNQNRDKEFDYLSDTIRDALRAKLQGTNLFNLANFSDVDKSASEVSRAELSSNENKAIDLALKLKSDVVITGKYAVVKGVVNISVNAIDALQSVSAISSSVNGEVGMNIFNLIDKISDDVSLKISKAFPKVDKSILDELIAKQEKKFEEARKAEEKNKKAAIK